MPDAEVHAVGQGAAQAGPVSPRLDERPGKPYEGVVSQTLTFSPNSRHLAYVAEEDGRHFVVVGESEGERYDEVLRRLVVFDSATRFHYLARRGNEILLVEERIE